MKNKFLFCMLLAIARIIPTYAQATIDGDYVIPDPQVWSFIKYGGSQPNLYTGTVSVSIPVYTYKDKDFTIPISLSYASNGYMPNVQAGEVGLGWFLNAGGCITRETRGIPDDCNGNVKDEKNFKILGYEYFHTTYTNPDSIDPCPLKRNLKNENGAYSPYYKSITKPGYYVETLPDIYHFNFMGHTGSFTFGEKGIEDICVFDSSEPYGTYKIKKLDAKTIIITTGDGYEYTFGGNLANRGAGKIESKTWSTGNIRSYEVVGDGQSQNTWLLTNIKAPNARTVNLGYGVKIQEIENVRPGCRNAAYWSIMGFSDLPPNYIPERYWLWSKNSTVQLSSIHISGGANISFSYSKRTPEQFCISGASPSELKSANKLSSIIVKHGSRVIKECQLEYSYSQPGDYHSQIMFLTGLNISGEGRYSMQYIDLAHRFPCHCTVSLDHWGYYNGYGYSNDKPNYDPATFLPETEIITQGNFENIKSKNRDPNPEYAKKGMLEKITYPTGGYTTFEYENHLYGQRLIVENTGGALNTPQIVGYSKPLMAGGMRIRKITDHAEGNSISREYIYTNIDNSKSSGILIHMPRYAYKFYGTTVTQEAWSTDQLYSYCTHKTHIGYEYVTEKFADGSSVRYHFNRPPGYTDLFRNHRGPDIISQFPDYVTIPQGQTFCRQPNYFNSLRGKLMGTTYYDSTGDAVKRISYFYDTNPYNYHLQDLLVVLGIEHGGDRYYVHKTCIKRNHLEWVETTDFTTDGSGSITTREEYAYNNLGQITDVKQTNSDGSIIHSLTRYPADLTPMEGSVEQIMLAHNMHNYPLEQKKTLQTSINGEQYSTEATKYEYQNRIFPLLTGIKKAMLVGKEHPLMTLPYRNVVTYTDFDIFGNVLQTRDKANVPTTYIWGYNGLYLVAKIVNCTLNEVEQITGLSSLRTAPLAGALPNSAFNNLYNPATISAYGYLATVYKHIPFVGVSSITNPSNCSTYYHYYDDFCNFGKLKTVRDEFGNLIQEYNYHIKNQ